MAPPIVPDSPVARTSLVTPAGDIKKGTGSLIAIAFGTLLLVFGMGWGVYAVVVTKAHTNFDIYLIGGCLFVAFICVLPANFAAAIEAIRPVVPWGRRSDDKG